MQKILNSFKRIIPGFVVDMGRPVYHFLMAWSGSVFYRHPSKDIFVIGVTGTKGKSTTIEMLNSILESKEKTALISTVRQKISDKTIEKKSTNTMAGRWQIQRFLRKAVREGCKYALVEVTSEGVASHRHKFIDWDAAFFLNLSPEHIEAHGSFEKYRKAKVSFFKYLKKSKKPLKYFVINNDDPNAPYFKDAAERVPYSRILDFKEDLAYRVMEHIRKNTNLDWARADFNLGNLSAAVKFSESLGIKEEEIKESLLNFTGVPGRMEFVIHEPIHVVIDYAHTPESMKALFKTLRGNYLNKDRSLICVFGSAGGGRDKWKRPKMGEMAESFCDKIILTSDDTYDENASNIIEDIKTGFSDLSNVQEEIDRRKAIKKALDMANEGDVVAILGIGSQRFLNVGGINMPWNERRTVEELLK